MAHLYASFADASLAEKAAGALLDYGVRQEDISLVANDEYGKAHETHGKLYGSGDTAIGTGAATTAFADSGFGAAPSAVGGLGQVGDRVAGSVSGAFGAEGTAAGYEAAADQKTGGANAGAVEGRQVAMYDNPGTPGTSADLNPADQGGPDSAANQGDVATAAKHGISTTTPEDAGEGAVKGTGIGLGVGILASLAALTIPGVGLVLGGGALAAALGATALTAGAGAIAGGATGYLKDQGIPADAAEHYHGTVSGGGAVLSINIPSGDVDQATDESVLSKYGAANVNAY